VPSDCGTQKLRLQHCATDAPPPRAELSCVQGSSLSRRWARVPLSIFCSSGTPDLVTAGWRGANHPTTTLVILRPCGASGRSRRRTTCCPTVRGARSTTPRSKARPGRDPSTMVCVNHRFPRLLRYQPMVRSLCLDTRYNARRFGSALVSLGSRDPPTYGVASGTSRV
jgi:hypothetical protein